MTIDKAALGRELRETKPAFCVCTDPAWRDEDSGDVECVWVLPADHLSDEELYDFYDQFSHDESKDLSWLVERDFELIWHDDFSEEDLWEPLGSLFLLWAEASSERNCGLRQPSFGVDD
jgi:hypothetical protein